MQRTDISSPTGTKAVPGRFKEGDRVLVKDLPNLFYNRTQMYLRGVEGTIAEIIYSTLIPEDEAFNRDDAPPQQFYIVRFRQKDLWPEYRFDKDTLQSELPDSWLEPAGGRPKATKH